MVASITNNTLFKVKLAFTVANITNNTLLKVKLAFMVASVTKNTLFKVKLAFTAASITNNTLFKVKLAFTVASLSQRVSGAFTLYGQKNCFHNVDIMGTGIKNAKVYICFKNINFLGEKMHQKVILKGTVSQKSWRDKAMVSQSRLQLRIATGFKIFLISPLFPAIFQRFHFA
jgi:hypothetical protein